MVMLAKIRRMHFAMACRCARSPSARASSRNTIRRWLRSGQSEPVYPRRASPLPARSLPVPVGDVAACRQPSSPAGTTHRQGAVLAVAGDRLSGHLHPGDGLHPPVGGRRRQPPPGLVPLHFPPGEAFQFDWSREYAFVGSHAKMPLDLAHVKLARSRAFWLVAYPTQSHEMLFDAHTQAFTASRARRGIYDNMKTAVDGSASTGNGGSTPASTP